MLTIFSDLASWKTAVEAAGLIVEMNGWEDVGGPESGPALSYVPALGLSPTEVTPEDGSRVVLAVFFEAMGSLGSPDYVAPRGAIADSAVELDSWADAEYGEA